MNISQRLGEMDDLVQHLIKLNQHHPGRFRQELKTLIGLIPPSALAKYWQERGGDILAHDRSERRFISANDRQQLKAQSAQIIIEQERIQALGDQLNRGWRIDQGVVDTPTSEECLVTIFPEGHGCKRQEPGGLHLILPRGMTLRFHMSKCELSLISPSEAEQIDEMSPKDNFFLDSSGVKRDYKFVYSVKRCPELYMWLMSDK